MTLCTFTYEPPAGLSNPSGHDTAPLRIYGQHPYPYWGERPEDHPLPVAHIEWSGLVTAPVDLPPGKYWAASVYFTKGRQLLYTCVEFIINGGPLNVTFGKTGRYFGAGVYVDHIEPFCPITIYCPEEFLPLDPMSAPTEGLHPKLNGGDVHQFIHQRYQSSIRPRAGEKPSYSIYTCAVPVGETVIAVSQFVPGTSRTRDWNPRSIFLEPDCGAIIRLKGWDELSDIKGPITGSAYPGPHGMHVTYVSLKG